MFSMKKSSKTSLGNIQVVAPKNQNIQETEQEEQEEQESIVKASVMDTTKNAAPSPSMSSLPVGKVNEINKETITHPVPTSTTAKKGSNGKIASIFKKSQTKDETHQIADTNDKKKEERKKKEDEK